LPDVRADRVCGWSNGSGATLSRVIGADRSLILGKLTAPGSVYLINPKGVVIGRTGGGRFAADGGRPVLAGLCLSTIGGTRPCIACGIWARRPGG
jgi:filamentous hemagglutinin family protein